MASEIPIIDAHIHLFPASEVSTLAWCKPDSPLSKQQSVDEYKAASSSAPPKGFIFVETDRKNDLEAGAKDSSGWEYPLMEVSWLKRIITGQPKAGEGHSEEDASLCVAYIPWAPMPSGAAVVEKYIELVKKEAGESWPKVRGFRYLLQDKPNGTMLQDNFIQSLKLLGRLGLVFDLGVDHHRRKKIQLDEVVEMIGRAHDGVPENEKVVIILNHMCKPELVENDSKESSFNAWCESMYTLSRYKQVYMKLSGAFSEMSDNDNKQSAEHIFDTILLKWAAVLLTVFKPERIMFASDWPVCTVGVGDSAWEKWKRVVDRLCWMASFDDDQKKKIFGGTALKAYGIEQ
ncbi:amidohydrolase [Xylariaceae sp. FL0255]|nr:amidohydrolase [Xylariaceae sp. FL0255]